MPPYPPPDAAERYETLRQEGLTLGWPRARGWGVFSRRGFLAWSLVVEPPLRKLPSIPVPVNDTVVFPAGLDQPFIQVMAGMVLNLRQEVHDAF